MCKISKMSKEKFICEKKLKDIKKFTWMRRQNKTILNIESFADLRLNTDHLYKEDKKKNKNLEIQNIVYENEYELKCCRMKYFCF